MHVIPEEEFRSRGLDQENLFPKERLVKAEEAVWELVELFCGQFFEPREFSSSAEADYPPMRLDGSGQASLLLPVPPITLETLSIESDSSTTLSDAVVYCRRYPDERMCPRLVLKEGTFPSGNQNVTLTGTFGFVEADGVSPPPPLVEAVTKFVVLAIEPLIGQIPYPAPKRGRVVSVISDEYSYKLQAGQAQNGLTRVEAIDKVLFMYSRGDSDFSMGAV